MQEKRACQSSATGSTSSTEIGCGPHQRVQPLAQPMRRQRSRDVDMRAHRQRMDARVGAPGGDELRLLAGHPLQRFLERLLDRRAHAPAAASP